MAERYLVLPGALISSALDDLDEAARIASVAADKDRTPRLLVRIVGEAKPRSTPNVDVVMYEDAEVAGG